jgi:hypothetical protein
MSVEPDKDFFFKFPDMPGLIAVCYIPLGEKPGTCVPYHV